MDALQTLLQEISFHVQHFYPVPENNITDAISVYDALEPFLHQLIDAAVTVKKDCSKTKVEAALLVSDIDDTVTRYHQMKAQGAALKLYPFQRLLHQGHQLAQLGERSGLTCEQGPALIIPGPGHQVGP